MKISELCRDKNKTAIFLDPSGAAFTFCKYKSTLADISEYKIALALGKTDKDKFIQSTRKKFVNNLKSGGQVCLSLDKESEDLNSIFGGQ